MNASPDIYFSFFMFTSELNIQNSESRKKWIDYIKILAKNGYKGFELPIESVKETIQEYAEKIEAFRLFRYELDQAGLTSIELTTNVSAAAALDPSSHDAGIRADGIEYLKSRIDITAALRGKVMMGSLVLPYGEWITKPNSASYNPENLWSDALQVELALRYENALPGFVELGEYAQSLGVKLAIEPITHWETPGFNTLAQLIPFLSRLESCSGDNKAVGAVIDSAHEILEGAGAELFAQQVATLANMNRLHYAQVSPPDRGAVYQSWIPWSDIFTPILQHYQGPIAVEIFNAIPAFTDLMRITRKKYWIPDVDPQGEEDLEAFTVAARSLEECQSRLSELQSTT